MCDCEYYKARMAELIKEKDEWSDTIKIQAEEIVQLRRDKVALQNKIDAAIEELS